MKRRRFPDEIMVTFYKDSEGLYISRVNEADLHDMKNRKRVAIYRLESVKVLEKTVTLIDERDLPFDAGLDETPPTVERSEPIQVDQPEEANL